MGWIDSHAHLYSKEFKEDLGKVMDRCDQEGVTKIYMPNVDHESIDGMMELEQRYPERCIATIGLHPCSVKKGFERELYIVEEWLGRRPFAAIGEMGTDLYWDKTFWDQQVEAFKIQLQWARQYRLPVIIHCRDSMDETIELVEQHGDGVKGVFHCFGGTLEQANKIISLNFMLGIGGVSTFKKGGLDRVLPDVDLEHLILETDSPYLAPTPYRGKRNEPSYIPLIGKRVSDIKQLDIVQVKEVTSANTLRLFSK